MGQAISGIGGGIIQGLGAKAEAEAAQEAAKFNAAQERRQRNEELEFLDRQRRIQRGENITRIAKSGVRVEGSPLEVLANNAAEIQRAKFNVRRNRDTRFELFMNAKKAAKFQEKLAIAGSIVQVAGSVVSALTSFGLGGGGASSGSTTPRTQTFNDPSLLRPGDIRADRDRFGFVRTTGDR